MNRLKILPSCSALKSNTAIQRWEISITTARLYQALVPKLRESGIRTFAEASQACRALSNTLDKQHRAGWITPEPDSGRDSAERMLDRIDSYPYRHRIRDVMSVPPKIISADHTLGDALAQLIRDRVSSLYVAPAGLRRSNSRHSPPASSPNATFCVHWPRTAKARCGWASNNL